MCVCCVCVCVCLCFFYLWDGCYIISWFGFPLEKESGADWVVIEVVAMRMQGPLDHTVHPDSKAKWYVTGFCPE